jgi:hypothetical protein
MDSVRRAVVVDTTEVPEDYAVVKAKILNHIELRNNRMCPVRRI